MRKIKLGSCILLFSFILSLTIAGVFLWFGGAMQNSFRTVNSDMDGIAILSSKDIADMQSGSVLLNTKQVVSPNNLSVAYAQEIFHKSSIVLVVICLITVVFSFGLWKILFKIQQKSDIALMKTFQKLTIQDTSNHDSIIIRTYKNIENQFQSHMTDYQRLHSYISHDQKNAISLLRLEMANQPEQLEIIDQMANNVDDILTLSEFKDFSNTYLVDLSLVCATACDTYRKVYSNIYFEFDENQEYSILAKERWLYRAISNVLDNAIKYGNNRDIHITIKNKNNSIIVAIKDEGIGIEPEMQKHIFDHQFRIHELQKDGYGIGLSLVSHVCDLCDGYIFVESKLHHGTTFYLSFPVAYVD